MQESLNQQFNQPIPCSSFIPGLPGNTLGFSPLIHPLIQKIKSHHFEKDFIRDVLNFLQNPNGDALFIAGHTGAGKTSGVIQTAARLYWPMQQFACHGRMEMSDLIGRYKLTSTGDSHAPIMKFAYGALPLAMKFGHILLLNELDYADPSEIAGLNDILEGRPLFISETNETIFPHEHFRVIATGNSFGSGDESGRYLGVMAQNMAFMDRFRVIEVQYLKAEDEINLLKSTFTFPDPKDNPAEAFFVKAVAVANAIRNAFIGNDNAIGALSITMSSRTLIRWMQLLFDVSPTSCNSPLEYSLLRALTNRCQPSERTAIHQIAKAEFGSDWGIQ